MGEVPLETAGERFDFDQNNPLHDIFRARVAAGPQKSDL
jgi:hypothetical protein